MSSSHINICVYSSEVELGRFHASEVRLPGYGGQMGVFYDHTDMGGALSVGIVEFLDQTDRSASKMNRRYFVRGGFFEMKNNTLTLLVNVWEPADEVDVGRAEKSKLRALNRLESAHQQVQVNTSRALDALKRAEVRLSLCENRKQA